MERDGPRGGEGDGSAPSRDLLDAVEEAARSVGGRAAAPGGVATHGPIVRFDPDRPGGRRWLPLLVLLPFLAAAAALLVIRAREEPPRARVEADLRWAVANVVRRVEELRARTGRLPAPGELQGLVSDLVVYEAVTGGYRVYGLRGPVRVEYDGSVPLERWVGTSGTRP